MRVVRDRSEALFEERLLAPAWLRWPKVAWFGLVGGWSGYSLGWGPSSHVTGLGLDQRWLGAVVIVVAIFLVVAEVAGLRVRVSRFAMRVTPDGPLAWLPVPIERIDRCQAARWVRPPLFLILSRVPEARAVASRCHSLDLLGPRSGVYVWLAKWPPLFIASRRPAELLAALAEAGVRVEPGVLELR